ncbi:MAG: hypothetical protein HY319_25740 [Armatimonadetes bacterium]|nr:hypothetical protein [Armatimonadota bacterium]
MMQGIHHHGRPDAFHNGTKPASAAANQNPQQVHQPPQSRGTEQAAQATQSRGADQTAQTSQANQPPATPQAGPTQPGLSASFHPSQELAHGPQARAMHQQSQLDPSYLAGAYASSENQSKAVAAAIVLQDLMHGLLEPEVHETEPLDRPIDEPEEYGTWCPEDGPARDEDYRDDEESLFDFREG